MSLSQRQQVFAYAVRLRLRPRRHQGLSQRRIEFRNFDAAAMPPDMRLDETVGDGTDLRLAVQFQLLPISYQLLKRLDLAVPNGLAPSISVPPPFSPTARVPEEKGGLEAKRLSLDLGNPPMPRYEMHPGFAQCPHLGHEGDGAPKSANLVARDRRIARAPRGAPITLFSGTGPCFSPVRRARIHRPIHQPAPGRNS